MSLTVENPISAIHLSCPNRLFIKEIKAFNPLIHETSEVFEINNWFPGKIVSSKLSHYSKYTVIISTSNRENGGTRNTVMLQCFDQNGNSSFPIDCGDKFDQGQNVKFMFDMKKIDIDRIEVWQILQSERVVTPIDAWHLDTIQVIDNNHIQNRGVRVSTLTTVLF